MKQEMLISNRSNFIWLILCVFKGIVYENDRFGYVRNIFLCILAIANLSDVCAKEACESRILSHNLEIELF